MRLKEIEGKKKMYINLDDAPQKSTSPSKIYIQSISSIEEFNFLKDVSPRMFRKIIMLHKPQKVIPK